MIVVVGGHTRNIGKTSAICQIIQSTPEAGWIAIKLSRHGHGSDLAGPLIIEETKASPSTDTGRYTTGTSEFTVKIDPENLGVMLRRKLDYSMANQRAEVYVSQPGAAESDWKLAGVWYTAGSNSALYSYPNDELGASQQAVEVSNRRFRDDEFLVPRELTQGKSAIRVRVKFTPSNKPLFPGSRRPTTFRAWSEFKYTAYSFIMPKFTP